MQLRKTLILGQHAARAPCSIDDVVVDGARKEEHVFDASRRQQLLGEFDAVAIGQGKIEYADVERVARCSRRLGGMDDGDGVAVRPQRFFESARHGRVVFDDQDSHGILPVLA